MRHRQRRDRGESRVGTEFVVEVGPVAHGGWCVARHEGRAVFVRHALPGERVRVSVTEGGEDDRFWRADAIEVLTPAADRVEPPCPYAGPGRCGGCDWQHASLPAQRQFKANVITEQLRRLAHLDREVVVEPVPGDDNGLGWRTRVTYAVDQAGRAGLRRHRSHDVVPIEECLIAHPGIRSMRVETVGWPGSASVEAAVSTTGDRVVVVDGAVDHVPHLGDEIVVWSAGVPSADDRPYLVERAAGHDWRVAAGGFWQVHPGAAEVLVEAVLHAVEPKPGERALDLYSGVGLFAGPLADLVGLSGTIVAVEASRRAVADARHNLRNRPWVDVVAGDVPRVLSDPRYRRDVDIVVLDPPRVGAKAPVVSAIAELGPRAVAYVACDPAALARDLATFAHVGYELVSLRAFDVFPMTHHVECVASLRRV